MEAVVPADGDATQQRGGTLAWRNDRLRLIGVAVLTTAFALLAYGVVDWTGTFAVRNVEVTGAPAEVSRAVESALGSLAGENLASLSKQEVLTLSKQVPQVLAVDVDRDFPGTLRVRVVLHQPVAVVRSGTSAWVVSRRGQVLETIEGSEARDLPRVWIPDGAAYEPGDVLVSATGLAAARALGRLPQPFPLRVVSARGSVDDLFLVVGVNERVELRLGEAESLRLKLAVAARVLRSLAPGEAQKLNYLDVSVPERPVAA
jgi:hypothetical protein